jgi:hypothetical protein
MHLAVRIANPAASESGWVVAVMLDTYGIPRVVHAVGTSFGRQQIQRTPQPSVKLMTGGGRGCSAGAVAVVGYLRLQTWVESGSSRCTASGPARSTRPVAQRRPAIPIVAAASPRNVADVTAGAVTIDRDWKYSRPRVILYE